jgi:hypothetical protein
MIFLKFIYPKVPSHLHELRGARLGDDDDDDDEESQSVRKVVIIACLKAVTGYA